MRWQLTWQRHWRFSLVCRPLSGSALIEHAVVNIDPPASDGRLDGGV
jgi:hypothetical protein